MNTVLLANLIKIRWIAIGGQLITLFIVYFFFKFSIPLEECLVVVFLSIRVSHQSRDWISSFQKVIDKHEEIIETHRLTGSDSDYLLKIVASSIEDYDNFQQKLIGELEFTKMSSSISLQEMKNSHNLPLKQLENF